MQTAERYRTELSASGEVILQLCNAIDSAEKAVWQKIADLIVRSRRVLVTGMASSMWAAWPMVTAMRLNRADIHLLPVYELLFGRMHSLYKDDLLLLVSQSGETIELTCLLDELDRLCRIHFPVVAVTNSLGSTLSKKADHVLDIQAGEEFCTPSKSYFNTVAALGLLWAVTTHPSDAALRWSSALRAAHACFPTYEEQCQSWARSVAARVGRPGAANAFHFLALGSQIGSAWQASLIFSETLKVPSCVLDWATFRHGFVPQVNPKTIVIGFEPPDTNRAVWRTTEREVQNGGGTILLVPSPERCHTFTPSELDTRWREVMVPVFETLPIHWLAVYLAEEWGVDPSQVRKVTRTL